MESQRARYGPAIAALLVAWFVFQQIKDIVLLRSDLKDMSDAIASFGPIELPAPIVRFILDFLVIFVISWLAAPGIVNTTSWVSRRVRDRRSALQPVRTLFSHADQEQIEWIRNLLPEPRWSRDRPPGTLTQKITQVLDRRGRQDRYLPYPASEYEEYLYRINPRLRFALRWRVWIRDFQMQRRRKLRIKERIRNADRPERQVLWLFWRPNIMQLEATMTRLDAQIAYLERDEVIEIIRSDRKKVGLRLGSDAVRSVEKYITKGKRIEHQEIRFDKG